MASTTSARAVFRLVGTAVGGLIGWTREVPSADPAALRSVFAELGVRVGPRPEDLTAAVRRFQVRAGLTPDGEAGPQTVHLLAQYARDRPRFAA
jgi:hypothetical protein